MNNSIIGKFCSVAKEGTIILPKEIPGYIAPEGQILKEDGQKFNFIYTPIKYNIQYELNGGSLDEHKDFYTIEDEDYIPSDPIKEDNIFIGWNPAKIFKGSIGDVKFVSNWKSNAILLPGKELNEAINKLANGKENILAIQEGQGTPSGGYIDISSTSEPIYASFSQGVLFIYCESDIWCNQDMSEAFKGFTLLTDINFLFSWRCKENTNICSLFEDCSMLSDVSPINGWGNGKFDKNKFTLAFKGTQANETGRVPSWYRYEVKISYKSSTGVELDSMTGNRIPNEVIYAKSIKGYTPITKSIEIDSCDKEYTFEYSPIVYNISYETSGGELQYPKKTYTIEDETYYPPEPIKSGFKFIGWNPEYISNGDYGNVSFVASYEKE